MTSRSAIAAALTGLLLLAVGCQSGPGRPMVNRQDPARFERCDDAAGQAAFEQAVVHLQGGRDEEALPLLRWVVEVCREQVVAHRYYQDLARQLGGQFEADMRAFYRDLPEDAASPVPTYVKVRLLESKFERKRELDQLLARFGDFAYGYLSLGRLNRAVGKLSDAADAFQRAIDRHPGLLEAHLELAEVLVELGRFGEAQLPYENYLAAAPNDLHAIRAVVHLLLYKLVKPDLARPWVQRLLSADARDEDARMDLAAADWLSGRLDEALRGYLTVLEQRPDNARATLNIGHLYYDAMVRSDEDRRQYWPKARMAYLLFLQLIRPEEGLDHFEQRLAVPFRLKAIDEFLGPGDGRAPRIEDLR